MGFLDEVFDQVFGTNFKPKSRKKDNRETRYYYGKKLILTTKDGKVEFQQPLKKEHLRTRPGYRYRKDWKGRTYKYKSHY